VRHGLRETQYNRNSITYRVGLKSVQDLDADEYSKAYEELDVPIQLVTRFFAPTSEDLVASFDFTICQFAAWLVKEPDRNVWHWDTYMPIEAFTDVMERKLVYTFPQRTEDVGASLIRAFKFASRGFTIDDDNVAKLTARVILRSRIAELYESYGEAFVKEEEVAAKLLDTFSIRLYPERALQFSSIDDAVPF
jgi:hypothetical protein